MKRACLLMLAVVVAAPVVFAASQAERVAAEVRSFTLLKSEHPKYPINPNAPIFDVVEERTGVRIKIQPVPSSDYDLKVTTMLASRNLPDVAQVSLDQVRDYAPKGAFVNLSKYPDRIKNVMAAMNREAPNDWRLLLVDGGLYAFPEIFGNDPGGTPGPSFRLDLLEKHGIPVPKTYREVYAALKTLKGIYPDSTPIAMRGYPGQFMPAITFGLGAVYGLDWDVDYEGGKYLYGPIHPEFKTVVQYLNVLYREGLLDPDFTASTSQAFVEKATSGKTYLCFENYNLVYEWHLSLRQNVPNARLEFFGFPANDKGQRRPWSFGVGIKGYNFAVNAALKDVSFIIDTIDWMYSEPGYMTMSWGVEGEDYEIVNGKPYNTDRILAMGNNQGQLYSWVEYGMGHNYFTPFSDARKFTSHSVTIEEKRTNAKSEMELRSEKVFADPSFAGGRYTRPSVTPPLTSEELERVKEIKTRCDTIMTPNVVSFITGKRPLAEYDAFVAELKRAGAEDLEGLYNTALARAK